MAPRVHRLCDTLAHGNVSYCVYSASPVSTVHTTISCFGIPNIGGILTVAGGMSTGNHCLGRCSCSLRPRARNINGTRALTGVLMPGCGNRNPDFATVSSRKSFGFYARFGSAGRILIVGQAHASSTTLYTNVTTCRGGRNVSLTTTGGGNSDLFLVRNHGRGGNRF